MKARTNLPMAIFGTACAVVAIAVLAGARDVPWSWGSWAAPLLLIGVGAAALVSVVARRP
jgi:hypothetical protein